MVLYKNGAINITCCPTITFSFDATLVYLETQAHDYAMLARQRQGYAVKV